MKRKTTITVDQMTQMVIGVLAAVVFLFMALERYPFLSQLLVGSFSLVCFKPAFTSMWFRSFGVRNSSRNMKKDQASSP
jgi:hypothetical protein